MSSPCRRGSLRVADGDVRETRDAADGGEIDGHRQLHEARRTQAGHGPLTSRVSAWQRAAEPQFGLWRRARAVLAQAAMSSPPLSIEALAERLPAKARLIGVDLGTKTIGLALSDVERRVATPLGVVKRTPLRQGRRGAERAHPRVRRLRAGRRPAAQHGRRRRPARPGDARLPAQFRPPRSDAGRPSGTSACRPRRSSAR